MEPWQLHSFLVIQVITGVLLIILALLIYKRNKDYEGNIYLSLGFSLYSLYPIGRFFYELGFSELAVHISLRISLIGSILGMGAFLIAISIFCLGSYAKELKKYKIIGGIITTLVCTIIILPSSITDVTVNPTSAIWSLILMIAFSFYIILTTSRMIYLLTNTLKEIKDHNPEITDKLKNLRLSLILSLGIVLFSIIENITQIHYFNIFTYLFLLLFIIFISYPLMKKKNDLKSV